MTDSKQNMILATEHEEDKNFDKQFAKLSLSPTASNAEITQTLSRSSSNETSLAETITILKEQVAKVNRNDLSELEETLTAQACSLNAIYGDLAKRGIQSDQLGKMQILMRLALKAQAQCARTIEILATMKTPPVVFAKQANISQGHQQINNEVKRDFSRNTRVHAHGEKHAELHQTNY